MSEQRLLDATQVAERLGIPRTAVWRLARDGSLPAVRLSPRRTRFTEHDVDRLIDRKTTTRPRTGGRS